MKLCCITSFISFGTALTRMNENVNFQNIEEEKEEVKIGIINQDNTKILGKPKEEIKNNRGNRNHDQIVSNNLGDRCFRADTFGDIRTRKEDCNVSSSDGDEDSDTDKTRSHSVCIEPLITKVKTIEVNNSNIMTSTDEFRYFSLSPKENYFNLDEDDKINKCDDPELPKKRLTYFHNCSPGGHFIRYSDSKKILEINILGIDFDILTAVFEFIDKNTTIVIYNIELNNYINYGSRGNINILLKVMKNHIQLFKSLSNPLELNARYVEDVNRNEQLSNKNKVFF